MFGPRCPASGRPCRQRVVLLDVQEAPARHEKAGVVEGEVIYFYLLTCFVLLSLTLCRLAGWNKLVVWCCRVIL